MHVLQLMRRTDSRWRTFCKSCGAAVPDVFSQQPDQPQQPNRSKKMALVLAIVASILAVAIVVLTIAILARPSTNDELTSEPQPATSEVQSTKEDKAESQGSKAQDSKDNKTKTEEAAPKPTTEQLAAKAYEAVLSEADSYFAEAWYDQYPDSEITYTLKNLTDDNLPELLLCAHYSNIGSHTSGGLRMIAFTYDEASGKAVEATGDYSLYAEPYSVMNYSPDDHAFLVELRYVHGTESEYYREYVSGTSLVRDQISADEAQGGAIIEDWKSLDDRSLVNNMQGQATDQEPAAQPTYPIQTSTTFETEEFKVTMPDYLANRFSVQENGSGDRTTWIFSTDVQTDSGMVYGGALIITSDGSMSTSGRTYFGCTSSGKHVYSEYGVQGGENIFHSASGQTDDTIAKVELK